MASRLERTSSWSSATAGAGRPPIVRSFAQMSLLATVAEAISAPLAVDIIADSAAASTRPLTPVGSTFFTMVANALSALGSVG